MPHIIPIKNLKNTAAISELCHQTGGSNYVTKNGYGDMVIMSIDAFHVINHIMSLYSEIESSEKDIESGDFEDGFHIVKELRAAHAIQNFCNENS